MWVCFLASCGINLFFNVCFSNEKKVNKYNEEQKYQFLSYLYSKNEAMTFEEATVLYERLRQYIVGTEMRGMKIESLCIAPTKWEEMTDFLNIQIKQGLDGAVEAFADKSFSVYGVSTDKSGDVPRSYMILLDYFDKVLDN